MFKTILDISSTYTRNNSFEPIPICVNIHIILVWLLAPDSQVGRAPYNRDQLRKGGGLAIRILWQVNLCQGKEPEMQIFEDHLGEEECEAQTSSIAGTI